jgi:hypothetical protein
MKIAFAGQLCFGKDCAADYLAKRLNKIGKTGDWYRTSFADAVKRIFCESFGVTRAFVEEWKRIPEPPPGMLKPIRQSLQFVGDGFRQIQDDIWIQKSLNNEAQEILADSRYYNEAIAVRARKGLNVVIYRHGFLNDDPNPSEAQVRPICEWCFKTQTDGPINHNVEGEKPKFSEYYDFYLNNSGTLEELYVKIDNLLIPYIENILRGKS